MQLFIRDYPRRVTIVCNVVGVTVFGFPSPGGYLRQKSFADGLYSVAVQ